MLVAAGWASAHTSSVAMARLKEHFSDRVISKGLRTFWSAYSPDLTPLDYYHWSTVEALVNRIDELSTIEQLRHKVELQCVPQLLIDFDEGMAISLRDAECAQR